LLLVSTSHFASEAELHVIRMDVIAMPCLPRGYNTFINWRDKANSANVYVGNGFTGYGCMAINMLSLHMHADEQLTAIYGFIERFRQYVQFGDWMTGNTRNPWRQSSA